MGAFLTTNRPLFTLPNHFGSPGLFRNLTDIRCIFADAFSVIIHIAVLLLLAKSMHINSTQVVINQNDIFRFKNLLSTQQTQFSLAVVTFLIVKMSS